MLRFSARVVLPTALPFSFCCGGIRMLAPSELLEKDQAHFLHPLHHPSTTSAPLIFESGNGIWLKTVEGKEYIDGLAGLWNVLIGHGNLELADVARDQIATLAYCSSYAG